MLNPDEMRQHLLESFQDICRKKGLRLTAQRLEIFNELAGRSDHPSAESIYESVRRRLPMISLDTVYRTLTTLKENGLVIGIRQGTDQCRYDAQIRMHHHLVCEGCGNVSDFEWPDFDCLDVPDAVRNWGDMSEQRIVIQGRCKTCLDKTERSS
jgi:Fur family peroxide stress response transcriptional regulator